ncbi:uncharacterized protein [Hemitrygon akajei]|uniref:uncharacterized protein n=1 Tax=Hemitrygon akajei TaxID=2704970 RepID=UPI003BF9B9F9
MDKRLSNLNRFKVRNTVSTITITELPYANDNTFAAHSEEEFQCILNAFLHDMESGMLTVLCSAGNLDYRCHMVRKRQKALLTPFLEFQGLPVKLKTGPGWVSASKTMWTLIILIGFLPVSGALWAEKYVKGVVGRAITIDCHYEAKYHSHTKYWCHGWTRECSVIVETNGQHGRRGRVSITDKSVQGIFSVTMEDLRSGDTGWYSCGITTPVIDPMFNVRLQVSNEPVSVPVLRYLSPANVSRLRASVLVSCESLQGSLPIQYTWHVKNSTISGTDKLDLHCHSLKYKNHLYYCKASNAIGENSSEVVNVSISNSVRTCRYVIEVNGMGPIYICENTVTEKTTTTGSKDSTPNKM